MALAPLGAQVRPYRDYLTPALHRRFNKASRYTLLLCYAIACWMGEWDSLLWLWFPIGPTGIRTLLLFIPALLVYVLRVAQWHVGHRHTLSRAHSFKKYVARKESLVTFVFYIFSAWLFAQVYTWSRTEKSKLAVTDAGRAHERLKLNERPLYLSYLFIALAAAQSLLHLWHDYDAIDVHAMKPRAHCLDAAPAAPPTRMPNPRRVLAASFQSMLVTSASLTLSVAVAASVLYFAVVRQQLWDRYYAFHRTFISLAKTSRPTGIAPAAPLFAMFAVEGTLLALMWQFVNKAFDLYIAQEPLKHGVPITNDSKDPNGTLLNGLKSKKEAVKAIAFWELALITDAFPDRRKTIYSEIDRKKAPTFNQVTDICLAELKLLIERLNVGLDPAYTPAAAPGAQQPVVPVNLVPQISNPIKDDRLVIAPPSNPITKWEQFEATTSGIAKAHSSSANVQQAYGREAINIGKKKAQEGAQQASSAYGVASEKVVSSPLGFVLSQPIQRKAKMVVLGAPYSRISLICNAVTALTNLTMFSISQDTLGRFHQGVPDMVRVFTLALNKIDEYMSKIEIHWSDKDAMAKPEAERKRVPEVEQVRDCLQEGLEKILGSFADYLSAMGMSRLEIMEANKAAKSAKKPEMIQAGAGR